MPTAPLSSPSQTLSRSAGLSRSGGAQQALAPRRKVRQHPESTIYDPSLTLKAWSSHRFSCEKHVMRTSLGIHAQQFGLGFANDADRVWRRNMHEQDRTVHDLAQGQDAVGGFCLNNGRARGTVMPRLGHSSRFKVFREPFDEITILGVNHCE